MQRPKTSPDQLFARRNIEFVMSSPFFDLDDVFHAFALGVVATASRSEGSWIELPIKNGGRRAVSALNNGESSCLLHRGRDGVRIFSKIGQKAGSHLGMLPSHGARIAWPQMSRESGWFFLRGLFEICGEIAKASEPSLWVRLRVPSEDLRRGIVEFVPSPVHCISGEQLEWRGASALDLLGELFFSPRMEEYSEFFRPGRLRRATRWMTRISGISADFHPEHEVSIFKLNEDAVLPTKARVSDSGYDLTLLYVKKKIGEVVLYGTGIVAEAPHGWYLDVVPRSSIIQRGYIIANSVGIIDRAYRGELMVPLIKVDKGAPELELPARIAQLIPRPIVHFNLRERYDLSETHRAQGGFGSTGR